MRILLVSFFVLVCLFSNGQQIKIGNVILDSAIARNYLFDCYAHPDTIKAKDLYSTCFTINGWGVNNYDECKANVDNFNEKLKHDAIGVIMDTIKWDKHQDTIWHYMWSTFGIVTNTWHHGKTFDSIKTVEAGQRVYPSNSYLVPRKPSEQDFIKWLSTH